MAKASIHVRKTHTRVTKRTTTKTTTRTRKKKGNPNHCPVCGKFIGNGKS